MSEKQESVEDILAEMRGPRFYPWGQGGFSVEMDLTPLADRIEAAHKRDIGAYDLINFMPPVGRVKPAPVGNSAMMRSAHIGIMLEMKDIGGIEVGRKVKFSPAAIEQQCAEALSAPPRNCDVGTAMEQGERFSAYCRAHKHPESECLHCPIFGQTGGYCELAWAQLPYEPEAEISKEAKGGEA